MGLHQTLRSTRRRSPPPRLRQVRCVPAGRAIAAVQSCRPKADAALQAMGCIPASKSWLRQHASMTVLQWPCSCLCPVQALAVTRRISTGQPPCDVTRAAQGQSILTLIATNMWGLPHMPVLMPAQHTTGLRGSGSASAIESPGSILKRASNRIRVALENQDSCKTGEQQHQSACCSAAPQALLTGWEYWWCKLPRLADSWAGREVAHCPCHHSGSQLIENASGLRQKGQAVLCWQPASGVKLLHAAHSHLHSGMGKVRAISA